MLALSVEAEESHIKHFHSLEDFQQSRHALPTTIQGLLRTEQLTDSINSPLLNVNKQSITQTENLLIGKKTQEIQTNNLEETNNAEKLFQNYIIYPDKHKPVRTEAKYIF